MGRTSNLQLREFCHLRCHKDAGKASNTCNYIQNYILWFNKECFTFYNVVGPQPWTESKTGMYSSPAIRVILGSTPHFLEWGYRTPTFYQQSQLWDD